MITPKSLPPSNAGIGNRLKKASASDISPPNMRNWTRPPVSIINSPTRAAPTGPERLLRAASLSFSRDEKRLLTIPASAG